HKAKEPGPIRALPSIVVMELYEIFEPLSYINPFRTAREKFRNYLIFLLLLHLGLRRGEILLLGLDAFHSEFDPSTGREFFWLIIDYVQSDVDENDDLPDPHVPAPSLKNNHARRLLPMSMDLFAATAVYVAGHRRSWRWPHLLIAQKGAPLSTRRLNEIFEIATVRLTPEARAALKARGKETIEPHDLRHTAAVRRLSGYREAGVAHSEAI